MKKQRFSTRHTFVALYIQQFQNSRFIISMGFFVLLPQRNS